MCVSKQDGYTALMMASQNGQTEVVKLLLKEGADINIENQVGTASFTLLFVAFLCIYEFRLLLWCSVV